MRKKILSLAATLASGAALMVAVPAVSASAATCYATDAYAPTLWLRSGPGFEYSVVGSMYQGETTAENCQDTYNEGTRWWFVWDGSRWAWANGKYLSQS